MKKPIKYVNLTEQWCNEKNSLLPIIESILSSGQLVGGEVVENFEKKIANYCKRKFCIALNSGTDALVMGLMALGVRKGDEVITPPNSFIASTSAIVHLNAKPVFVDVLPDQNVDPEKIERAITKKTKAIMPVHLTGRIAKMDAIMKIADEHKIPVIEDAAQAIGSFYLGVQSGTFGKIGCFSAHPLKNLNACGDAGFLITDDEKINKHVRLHRNHGLINRDIVKKFGFVSRMDTLQAGILSFRIENLNKTIKKRRENAKFYINNINQDNVYIPEEDEKEINSYHTFVIQCNRRNELKSFLDARGIETAIHYPVPIHLQPAASYLNHKLGDFPAVEKQTDEILTLPIHQYLDDKTLKYITESINDFYS